MPSVSDSLRRTRIQWQQARRLLSERGVAGVLSRVRQRATGERIERPLDALDFIRSRPVGRAEDVGCAEPRSIHWVVPPFERGSGGHTTIFRLVKRLERAGARNTIVVQDGHYFGDPSYFAGVIRDHFVPLDARVVTAMEDAPPAEVTVATSWLTAYRVRDFRPTRHRAYLVQDFEPWFYPVGSDHALAEATYRMGFVGITAGTWLRDTLRDRYGMEAHAFGFSFDRDVYQPPPSRPQQANTVFFYARPVTARRAFELGLMVLREVVRRRPGTRVVLAGGDLSGYDIPFPHESAGVVSVAELARLYGESDVALVFSLTNASLIPLETMACGTVVVSNDGPSVEWLLPRDCALLVPPTLEAMTDAVTRVLDDPVLRAGLRERGLAFARGTSWDTEADRVAAVFEDLFGRGGASAPPDAGR